MAAATRTARVITQTRGTAISRARTALLCAPPSGMLPGYVHSKTAEINRQPRRLETVVSHTKQTSTTQINRQHFSTSRKRSHRAISGHSPLTTSHCLIDQKSPVADLESRSTSHDSRSSSRTCQGAKKQQLRQPRSNPLGLYFVASYAHFSIGRQRALRHNGGTEVAASYNDKHRTALVGMEPSRERQSIIR